MKNYVRNILIFVVTFSLVFGLCLVPSFAVDSSSLEVLYYDSPNSSLIGGPHEGITFATYETTYKNVFKISEDVTSYFFAYPSSNTGYYRFAYVVDNDSFYQSASSDYILGRWNVRSGEALSKSRFSLDSNSNLAYFTTTNDLDSTYTFNCVIYDSLSAGLLAVRNYIDNGGVSETTYNAYFDIPCGNVAYIKTGNDNTLTLSCNMPEFSKLTGSTGTYWTNTMEIAYGVPSYPPAGTTFPLSSMSDIQWFRSTEGRDLLGRTKKALFLDTTQSSDNFIVIYNPTYRELTMSGQGDINPTIRVQCSALIDYHMYSLTGEYNSQGTISSYSIDGFSDPYIGTPTSDNENVQGTNSAGATPNIGGSGNEIGGTGGIIEYVQGIQNTLDNFANSFISLLRAPISHIQSLISSGTDYFNVIRGLYGWLPDEVQGTINSAMIVSISVGVIALLL